MFVHSTRRRCLGALLLAALLGSGAGVPVAAATNIDGYQFDDTVQLAGRELKLNGAGMRTKFMFKVYAAGLYLPEKKSTVADILKQDGPRRVTVLMAREVGADTFAKAFIEGLNDNVDKAERARLAPQMGKFEAVLTAVDKLKKGDVLHLDWVPGSGTQCALNGRKLGETIPDLAFYNAVLRIWLGDKPVDSSLKPALLGMDR